MTTLLDVKLSVTPEVLTYLQHEAEARNMPLDDVISEVLAAYFEDASQAEILQGLREGFRDVFRGNTRPAREFLDELDHEGHADTR